MRAIITISVFMVLFSMNAQEAKVRLMYGRVFDKHSRLGIDSVQITTKDTLYSTTTSENGSFEMDIPRRTRALYFSNDKYIAVKKRLSPRAQAVRLDVLMNALSYTSETYGPLTEKSIEVKMKLMYGRVSDKHSRLGIDSVQITTKDTLYSATTSENGSFEMNIPQRTRVLYFHQDRYKDVKIRLSPPARRLDASMRTLSYMSETYGPPTGKFMVGWLPLKLAWGALGGKLEVFPFKKHSLGAYFDWYFAGIQFFGGEEYTGYKIVPFYRYYIRRDAHVGYFVQASGMVGYFDFTKLNYFNHNQYPYEISKTYILKSYGFGVGGGISIVMNHTKYKHIIFDIYIGYQNFPEDWPKKATNGIIPTIFSHDATWWYIGGPGSEIDIKLTIGGIF